MKWTAAYTEGSARESATDNNKENGTSSEIAKPAGHLTSSYHVEGNIMETALICVENNGEESKNTVIACQCAKDRKNFGKGAKRTD